MAIDMFQSRIMLDAHQEVHKARRFLTTLFFSAEEEHGEENIDITIYKGKRKMAPFVAPRAEGRVMKREGRTVKSYKVPYLKPKRPTSAQDIMKRGNSSGVYTPQQLLQKSLERLGEDMAELQDSIDRREEWMIASTLTTGKVVVSGVVDDGDDAAVVDDEIDFGLDATHNVTLVGAALWTDAASDPIADLRAWKSRIAKNSGLSARAVVFGGDVATAFINNVKVKDSLNNRRIKSGQIEPEELPDGVIYLGYLNDPGLDVYTYDEWYIDDDGDEQPMVPVDRIIMASTSARFTRHYGPIMDLEAIDQGMAVGKVFPKSWVTKDPSVRWLMLQSAPLPIPHQIDGFLTAKVV